MPIVPILVVAGLAGGTGFLMGAEMRRSLMYAAMGAGAFVAAKHFKVI